MLRNRDDAEEAAQEALLRAWRYRESLRNADRREAWIATIARNSALRYAGRAASAGRPRTQPLPEEGIAIEDPALAAAVDHTAFESALGDLEQIDRDLVRLRYVEDLPYRDIAERLSIPLGTTKVRLHRLHKRLKIVYEEQRPRA